VRHRSFAHCSAPHLALHSFPTRRSSDLVVTATSASHNVAGGTQVRPIQPANPTAQASNSAPVRLFQFHSEKSTPRLGSASNSATDRKSTRLNSSHVKISYAVFCLNKKKK